MLKKKIMSKKQNKPKKAIKYEDLRDKWYARIKTKGFNDIEQTKDGQLSYGLGKNFRLKQNSLTEEYYYLARQFLNDYQFEDEIQKVIWEYHSEGLSTRDIAETLRKVFQTEFKQGFDYLVLRYKQGHLDIPELYKKLRKLKMRRPYFGDIQVIVNDLKDKMKQMYIGKATSV